MSVAILMEYKHIKNNLHSTETDSSQNIVGKIKLDQKLLDGIKSLAKTGLVENELIFYSGNQKKHITVDALDSSHFNQEITITLEGHVVKDAYFIGNSWDDLLAYYNYIKTPPEAIYLHSLDDVIDKDSGDEKYNNLQNVSQLSKVLDSIADLSSADSWILIYGQKVEIPKVFNIDALSHPLSILPLTKLITEEIHSDAKQNLLKSVLVDLLSKVKFEKRFVVFIENFPIVFTNFMLGYQSFVSNYSFDKVRREYEEKRTEYISKINHAFQDVGSKFILLPAPLWLAMTQSKSIRDAKNNLQLLELFKNIDIIVITILVSLFLFFLILAQDSYLKSLKKEFTQLFERLKSEYSEVEFNKDSELNTLNNRYTWVWAQLWAVNIINIVMAILAIVIVCQTF